MRHRPIKTVCMNILRAMVQTNSSLTPRQISEISGFKLRRTVYDSLRYLKLLNFVEMEKFPNRRVKFTATKNGRRAIKYILNSYNEQELDEPDGELPY